MKVELPRQFSKNPKMPNLMKILAVGTRFFHAEGRTYIHTYIETDRHEVPNSRFSQFCERH